MQQRFATLGIRNGFTLVELAVVIVILGMLAAFGVPKYLNSIEKSKAAEAFNYLSAVQSAQARYRAQNGVYASAISSLDITLSAPRYFTVGTISTTTSPNDSPGWSLQLDRNSSSGYSYNVIWNQDGLDISSSIMSCRAICPVTIATGSGGSGS
jgi:prepilin-type N-terminal cleavage/methylation domain-containing protein